jgi:predicted DNA-binding mobile mystery protein A
MKRNKIQLDHLEMKIRMFAPLTKVAIPPTGWIKAVRMALGMSLQQLANRISITKQSVQEMEKREKEGSISLKSLRDAAQALDMEFVYGFVPKDGSLDALIDRKSEEFATKIVNRTSQTMRLEDQENSEIRLGKAIQERKAMLKQEIPKVLWD